MIWVLIGVVAVISGVIGAIGMCYWLAYKVWQNI